jgi:hypothetical protein
MVYLGTFVQDGFAEMPSVTWRIVFFFWQAKFNTGICALQRKSDKFQKEMLANISSNVNMSRVPINWFGRNSRRGFS